MIPDVFANSKIYYQQRPENLSFLARAWSNWKVSAWWMCLLIIAPLLFSLHYKLVFNMTPSLNFKVAVIEKGLQPTHHGQLVAYRWHGGASIPAGLEMVKRVMGMRGDQIERLPIEPQAGQSPVSMVYAYEVSLYRPSGLEYARYKVKRLARDGQLLAPIESQVIRRGQYFVAADHPDSLDSRYSVTGLIHADQVIGRVIWSW
jgi:conjugal transfer pilin signal peptidase TrbI